MQLGCQSDYCICFPQGKTQAFPSSTWIVFGNSYYENGTVGGGRTGRVKKNVLHLLCVSLSFLWHILHIHERCDTRRQCGRSNLLAWMQKWKARHYYSCCSCSLLAAAVRWCACMQHRRKVTQTLYGNCKYFSLWVYTSSSYVYCYKREASLISLGLHWVKRKFFFGMSTYGNCHQLQIISSTWSLVIPREVMHKEWRDSWRQRFHSSGENWPQVN